MNRRTAFCALSLVALFLVLAAPHVLAAPDQNYSYARIVRLSYVEGDVQVQRPEETGWEDALLNLPIRQGYQVSTRQGRAEIEFESGAVARLADDTLLQFTELALANGGRLTQLSFLRGTATFYVNLSTDDRFTITTPHFTISVPRNARFRIDSGPDGATLAVHKGDVDVEALGAPYHVTKNRAFLFRAEGEQITLARAPELDAWDRWVENRENILSASREAASSRYVRTSYSYGLSDLDYYGGWYNVSGYGRCWQPRGLGLGWTPYRFGRWVYLSGYGLTWVSFEPWGWTPYHFGHWVYLPGGWYWVPGGSHFWQPALVYWVNLGGNRFGWGPRHPHDQPGGPPNNLPHGTVATGNTPTGYGSVDRRNQLLTAAEIARGRLVNEPPDSIAGAATFRGRMVPGDDGEAVATRPRATADSATPANSGSATSTAPAGAAAPASGNSGAALPRDASPESRPRARSGGADSQSGIVYDRAQRRFINSDDPPRVNAASRAEATDSPAAPATSATRVFSGATGATPETRPTPAAEIRRADHPQVLHDENRMPGRRDVQESAPGRPVLPRYESQPQRPASAPQSQPQPQPRAESPRQASQQQPRGGSESRPSSPPPPSSPRVEPARPSAPRPAPPASSPRSEPHERPHNRPPANQ